MDILQRINRALVMENTPSDPVIIDITDQAARKRALHNCRAPHVGWEDYIAGRDYQPPTFYNSDVPMGPQDDRGNPNSRKYGGVRPWSADEIMATILWPLPARMPHRDEDPERLGLLWTIAKKSTIRRSFLANTRTWGEGDLEEAVSLGVSAAFRAISGDEGRKGVRFTSFLGTWIEPGMKEGIPAGYENEYRYTRGVLSRFDQIGRAANRAIAAGEDVQPFVTQMEDELSGIDPNPGPKNRSTINVYDQGRTDKKDPSKNRPAGMVKREVNLGNLAPTVIQVGEKLRDGIATADQTQVTQALQYLEQERAKIEEQEDLYTTQGPKTGGSVITKPKDEVTLGTKPLTIKSKKTGEETERPDLPTGQLDSLRSEENMEVLERAIALMRTGLGHGRSWAAERAMQAIGRLKAAATSGTQGRQYKLQGGGKNVQVVDAETGDVVGDHDDEADARRQMAELQKSRPIQTIKAVVQAITPEYGEYAEEIRNAATELQQALVGGGDVSEVLQELGDLEQVAAQDRAAGDKSMEVEPVTQQEYRVLLRLFGIKNYPERGTVDDPEIDETGRLSDWARRGYPPITNNKEIAQDLWAVDPKSKQRRPISEVRVSQIRKSALAKFEGALKRLTNNLEEALGLDEIDKQLLFELRVKIGWILAEEILGVPVILG